jgi:hypothetical protein
VKVHPSLLRRFYLQRGVDAVIATTGSQALSLQAKKEQGQAMYRHSLWQKLWIPWALAMVLRSVLSAPCWKAWGSLKPLIEVSG